MTRTYSDHSALYPQKIDGEWYEVIKCSHNNDTFNVPLYDWQHPKELICPLCNELFRKAASLV